MIRVTNKWQTPVDAIPSVKFICCKRKLPIIKCCPIYAKDKSNVGSIAQYVNLHMSYIQFLIVNITYYPLNIYVCYTYVYTYFGQYTVHVMWGEVLVNCRALP